MAFYLLPLSTGGLSLEFASKDFDLPKAAIFELYGATQQNWHAEFAEVRFGGGLFVYTAEWDDPCLISETANGAIMLREIFESLKVS